MHLAPAFAAPPMFHHSPRVAAEAARSSAVADESVAPVAATQAPSARAATAQQTREESSVNRRMTARDFAALQAELGIAARREPEEDPGIPGDVTPPELLELHDDEHELGIVEIPDAPEHRDFSEAVADAVVTIDEYLDWVLEAGIGTR